MFWSGNGWLAFRMARVGCASQFIAEKIALPGIFILACAASFHESLKKQNAVARCLALCLPQIGLVLNSRQAATYMAAPQRLSGLARYPDTGVKLPLSTG